jgi:hypothetical protein
LESLFGVASRDCGSSCTPFVGDLKALAGNWGFVVGLVLIVKGFATFAADFVLSLASVAGVVCIANPAAPRRLASEFAFVAQVALVGLPGPGEGCTAASLLLPAKLKDGICSIGCDSWLWRSLWGWPSKTSI